MVASGENYSGDKKNLFFLVIKKNYFFPVSLVLLTLSPMSIIHDGGLTPD
jgi:hypothetical protein